VSIRSGKWKFEDGLRQPWPPFKEKSFWKRFFALLKGTGTRDYNWLKVVWYDGSWLRESPANIQKNFNCSFNFLLN
jgi:hypothetical protein